MGTEIKFVGEQILFDGTEIAFDDACCCEVDCETFCDTPLPSTFDVDIDHAAFFRVVTGCDYDTGTGQSPYGGAFECQFLGSVGGTCRWYYCDDDPCNPGKKFVISPYAIGSILGTSIFYGVVAASCSKADIIAALEAGDTNGFDDFYESGYSAMDCCTISGDFLQHQNFTGESHVTLGDNGLTITGNC